jgi:phage terminase large subunit
MKLKIKGTPVLNKIMASKKRFVLSVGSSRSSKTYSMLQWILIHCISNPGKGDYISVVRASFPSLRRTVYREFVDLLKEQGMYSEDRHNKTEHTIEIAGNFVEFFSLGDSQKVRGAKRDYLYLNECNEIPYEMAQQLFLRTEQRVFMDQNPSDIWHWSFKMKDKDNVDYIHSTYLDNPFLTKATIDQIEGYKDTDENFYRIYALGLPGFSTTTIYSHWKEYREKDMKVYSEDGEEQPWYDTYVYGLDVGYGHEMALTKCYFKEDEVWVEEIVYQSGLTSNDLIKLINDLGLNKDTDMWVDAAAPSMIEDLRRAGYNAKSADKKVKEGIDMIKSKKLNIEESSTNLVNEMRKYQWKSKNETIIYEPVKIGDDLVDAMRYAIWNYYRTTKRFDDYDFDVDFVDL